MNINFFLAGAVALKLAQDDHNDNESDLQKNKRNLKVELKEQELANEDLIKTLIRVHFSSWFALWGRILYLYWVILGGHLVFEGKLKGKNLTTDKVHYKEFLYLKNYFFL